MIPGYATVFFIPGTGTKNGPPGSGMPTRVIISHFSSLFPLVFFTRVPVILMSTCQWILDVRFAKIHVQGEQNSLKQYMFQTKLIFYIYLHQQKGAQIVETNKTSDRHVSAGLGEIISTHPQTQRC
jgi:hypothetical protein